MVCGCARGADYIGGHWWAEKMCIPVRHFPADWDMYGKSAGPLRNRQMAKYVDEAFPDGGALVFWNGTSRGSQHMIGLCEEFKIPLYVKRIT